MAKLDSIINSAFLFLEDKPQGTVSLKNKVVLDTSLDETYLNKINKTVKRKKDNPADSLQGYDVDASFAVKYPVPFLLSALPLMLSNTALIKTKKTVSRHVGFEEALSLNRLKRTVTEPKITDRLTKSSEGNAHSKRSLSDGITHNTVALSLEKQEFDRLPPGQVQQPVSSFQTKHTLFSALHSSDSTMTTAVSNTIQHEKETELGHSVLSLVSSGSHDLNRAVLTPVAPPTPTPTVQLRTPTHMPEQVLSTPEKTIVKEGDNQMIYHFNKWQGSNSVRVQWDNNDAHRVYMVPSNATVLGHITDHVDQLAPKLNIILREEEQRHHSKQRDPNESREDEKGKK